METGPRPSGRGSQWRIIRDRLAAATRGEFEIVRMVGYGAMGAVFLAQDVALERPVAIKVMSPALLMDEAMVQRFRLEARTIASLRHQNIVTVHAVRQVEDLHYFVMDFVSGPSLRTVLASEPNGLSVPIVKALLFQIAMGLEYAHRRGGGIVHRDVKPSNIIVDRDGSAIVTDFGISKVADSSAGLTMTGMIIGTPEYMSPEQWRDEPLSGASDQYALGVVAYEMLCGETPFKGPQHVVMGAHLNKDPEPIGSRRPDCPPELAETVMRMLAKSVSERWPDLVAAVSHYGGQPVAHGHPVQVEIAGIAERYVQSVAEPGPEPAAESKPPPPAAGAASVVIARFPSKVEPGDEFDVRAYVQNARGSNVGDAHIAWSSGDADIAVVKDGTVRALRPGAVSITAAVGELQDTLILMVGEPEVARVGLSPASVRIEVGEELDLAVEARDRHDNVLSVTPVWRSDRGDVVRVSEQGRVTALAPGSGKITVECGDVEATASISVVPASVASIDLGPVPPDLEPGDRFTIQARALDSRGNPLEGRPMEWETADPSVVRVRDGAVEAWAAGTSTIRARSEGQVASVTVSVGPPAVREIELGGAPPTLLPGDVFQVQATINGKAGRSIHAPLTWSSTDADVVSVEAGRVVAREPGMARIVATSGDVQADLPLEVQGRAAAELKLSPARGRVEVGGSLTMTAEARDQRGEPIASRPEWSTTDAHVAVVTPEGEVYGLSPGHARVGARVGDVAAGVDVEVVPVAVATIEVSASTTELLVGDTLKLVASCSDARGEPLTDRRVAWRSSDPGVATVDGNGTVSARGTGAVVLEASCEERTASWRLNIAARPAVDVEVAGPGSISVGKRATLTAIPRDQAGRQADRPVAWVSSDPEIATVDDQGRIRARRAGRVTMTAVADAARGTVTLQVEPRTGGWRRPSVIGGIGALAIAVVIAVAVLPLGSPSDSGEVTALVMSPSDLELEVGQASLVRARAVTDEGAAIANPAVVWSVDDSTVALVGQDGTVTALAAGTALISATLEGVTSSTRLRVNEPPADRFVQSVTVTADRTRLDVGERARLTARGIGAQGEPVEAGEPIWSVDDPAILRVDPDGTVVALAAGTAQVTASVDDVPGTIRMTVEGTETPPERVTVSSVHVSVASSSMAESGRQDISVEVRTSDGRVRRALGQGGSLSSTNPGVLSVEGTVVVARSSGAAWVVAAVDGFRDSVRITVESRIAGVRIETRDARVPVGGEVALGVTLVDAGGRAQSGQAPTWSSSDPSIAAVRGPSGTVTGVSPGVARITAELGALVDEVAVTVAGPATGPPSREVAQTHAEGIIALLNGGDRDAVANLLTGDRSDELLDLMGENRFEATLAGIGQVQAPDGRATLPLEVAVTYRNFSGRERQRAVDLLAVLERGDGGWVLTNIGVTGVREP